MTNKLSWESVKVNEIMLSMWQVRLQARDGSGLTDVAVLTVYIQRNLFAPVLSQTIYERVIQETTPVSTSILNLFAQDSDQTVSTVSDDILGESLYQLKYTIVYFLP